jgi:hypothetical protein
MVATPTRRRRILDALKARAQKITIANGYATDAGLRVLIGRQVVSKDDTFPLIAMAVAPEPVLRGAGDRARLNLDVEFHALATADVDDPLRPVEDLLGDLKRALFRKEDRTLNGAAIDVAYVGEGTLEREEGGAIVGVRVRLTADYVEMYGDPSA